MTDRPTLTGLHEHIANLLAAMGDQPAAVAATLRIEEVRGVRGSALAHPVCRWLVRLVPDLGAVLGLDSVHVFRPARGGALQRAIVLLPAPVNTFVDRFDDGQHPDLELWLGPPVPIASRRWHGRPRRELGSDTIQLPVLPPQPRSSAVPGSDVVVDGEVVGERAGLAGEDVTGGELLRL